MIEIILKKELCYLNSDVNYSFIKNKLIKNEYISNKKIDFNLEFCSCKYKNSKLIKKCVTCKYKDIDVKNI